ncbi:uncharacterized protein [Musca autumnalis]|uniref:uncharacterized protein n=1 Tax=Musca autumnalis TaxID=221902 RepID=UPI003CE91B90
MRNICKIIFLALIVGCISVQSDGEVYDYTYENQDNWGDKYEQCGADNPYSPRDIQTALAIPKIERSLVFLNFDLPATVEAYNTGNFIELKFKGLIRPQIIFYGVIYTCEKMRIHNRHNGAPSSEHSFDGKKGDLEFQYYCHNEIHGTVAVAVLAKIDLNIKVGVLASLVNIVGNCIVPGVRITAIVQPGIFLNLINRSDFYYYTGCETSPPCQAPITFIVMAGIRGIAQADVDILALLCDANGKQIGTNCRKQNNSHGEIIHVIPQ